MSTPIFYVHVQARGCQGEVRLNDAPIIDLSLDYPQHAFPTVSEWVINGENLLSVSLEALDEGARVRVALCQANLGDVPEPDRAFEHALVEWPPALPAGVEQPELPAPLPLPTVLSAAAIVSHPWGEWSWQRSPAFDVDARTTAAVIAYVRDLHATLATGSVDALAAHSRIKFDEVAPVYDMSSAEAQARLTNTWSHLTGLPGWQLADFDEADVELRLHCGGQLVEPCTLEGEPVIRQARAIDGERWSMQIFIARTNWEYVAGQLTIVR